MPVRSVKKYIILCSFGEMESSEQISADLEQFSIKDAEKVQGDHILLSFLGHFTIFDPLRVCLMIIRNIAWDEMCLFFK